MATQFDKRVLATLATTVALLMAPSVHAAITISSEPTENMSCSEGVCVPTASAAILNAGDLQTMLGAGSVMVKTTGSGGTEAEDIIGKAKISWSTTSVLSLDAQRSITLEKKVLVQGLGGFALTTNDGGSGGLLSFRNTGNVTFKNLSSPLTINGKSYQLFKSIAKLANAVAKNPSGAFALADNYNAAGDGTYSQSPVPTSLTGSFEGLGNTISNVSIVAHRQSYVGGLFSGIDTNGIVENLSISVNVKVSHPTSAGGLAGFNDGTVHGVASSGSLSGAGAVGGLIGDNTGTVTNLYSASAVELTGGYTGGLFGYGGGLIGVNRGTISSSFAVGHVTGKKKGDLGGLVGLDYCCIANSYSIGSVSGSPDSDVGGFEGATFGGVSDSYSIGRVTSKSDIAAGFIGYNDSDETNSDCYWDTKTSNRENGVGSGSAVGVTGLTSKQLKSGLPAGFDPSVWAQDAKINNGYPYLIMNPPPK